MRSIILASAACLGVAGCFNPLNLTAQQQANLQAELALGKMVVQATANIYCVVEPTTTKIIGIFDTSKSTTTMITKIDTATAALCTAAVGKAS
jgi:hypothetical protein